MMFGMALRLSGATAALIWAMAAPAAAEFSLQDVGSLSGNYLAARSADKARDGQEASDYLTRALLLDPDNPALVERLFLLELQAGDMPAAEELASKVLKFNSQQRMARLTMGLRDLRERRYEKARRNFEEASYTPVGQLTSALLIAWSYAGEGNMPEAMKALDRLDQNEAFANFKAYHAALIADRLSNDIRAEAAYKTAVEKSGNSLRVVQGYGNFLERHKRSEEAVKLYETFLRNGDGNSLIELAVRNARGKKTPQPFITSARAGAAESLFSLASAMTDEQSVQVAQLYAQLSISLDGDKPVVQTLVGDLYAQQKKYQEAIDAYDLIPDASPLRMNADLEVAINLQRLERNKEAIEKLAALTSANPTNYDALVTLGNIYRVNEDHAKAAEAYSKALALLPEIKKEHWRILYYRGIAYEAQKQWDKAEPDFRKALSLQPEEPMVLNYLGYAMIDRKMNLNEALGMVKKAVELKPNDGYIVDSLGWAHYQLGDYEEALTHVERAVDLVPADPIISEHLGDVYWKVGRQLEAKFQWQHAKDNKPEPADLKRIEDKLKNGLPPDAMTKPAQNGAAQTNG
jgi:tetratricopeptide (TPR) repeat protein